MSTSFGEQGAVQKDKCAMNIASFSGGKDSTAMVLKMFEEGIPTESALSGIDHIAFVDMGKEFPAMLKHIDKVEKYIGMKITRLYVPFDYWFSEHIKTKGKRIGEAGYGWPGITQRWCTYRKMSALKRYIEQFDNPVEFVGIAYDEKERRIANSDKRYPLVEWGMTEADCLEYCYQRGFDWDGLYQIFRRVSCFCCPFQRVSELRKLYENFPDLWKQLEVMDRKATWGRFKMGSSAGEWSDANRLKEMEQEDGHLKFKMDCSVADWAERFKLEAKQLTLEI